MSLFNDIGNYFGKVGTAIKNAVHEIVEGIKRIIQAIFDLVRDAPVVETLELATMV